MALSVMCGCAASCGEKSSDISQVKKTGVSDEAVKAKENLAKSLKAELMDVQRDFDYVNSITLLADSSNVFISARKKDDDEHERYYIADTSFSQIKELQIALEDTDKDTSYTQVAAAGNGTICILQTINDYGDMKVPDEYDEDFDYDALEEARTTTYKFYNIDADGNIIAKADLDDLKDYAGSENFYAGQLYRFGKDKMLLDLNDPTGDSGKLVALDLSGKILGEVDNAGMQWLQGSVMTSDGKTLLCGYGTMGMNIEYYDTDTMKPTGDELKIDDSSVYNMNMMLDGDENNLLYMVSLSGLYAVKADGTAEEQINWSDCDLDTNGMILAIPVGGGEYIIYNQTYGEDGDSGEFYRLVERDASELENTKIITIGTLYDDYQITQKINNFNKSHDDIRIKAVNYEKYNDYDEENEKYNNSAARQLKMDIVAGKAPDMIVTYDRSVISSLAGKDIFTDLYGLMDKDLSKDMILDNILKASECDGKLLALSPTFYVNTLACKTKYCDIENWTFDDLKKTYESLPDGMGLCELDSNEAVLQLVLSGLTDYIDYSNNTCNFDTPEFKDMIEFCAKFPDTEEIIDWKNASNEEMNEFSDDMMAKFKEDRALVSSLYISDFRDYKMAKQGTFGDDITLVGLPSSDGKGSKLGFDQNFAILDSSDAKAECWDFIKGFFTEEAYKEAHSFPVTKDGFEKKAENAMKKRTYTDENGKEVEYDDHFYIGNKEITIDPLTEEEKDYIVDYVRNTTAVSSEISDEIAEMGMECLKPYFKGEKSLDETIELLQSKISIYLSEQS